MKTILMKDSETVATNKGPVVFKRGETYTVEDWIATSLVGRDMASMVMGESSAVPSSELQGVVKSIGDLGEKNISELRDLAQNLGIADWKTMKKGDLKVAIEGKSAEILSTPMSPTSSFEPIDLTKGITPPESKVE